MIHFLKSLPCTGIDINDLTEMNNNDFGTNDKPAGLSRIKGFHDNFNISRASLHRR